MISKAESQLTPSKAVVDSAQFALNTTVEAMIVALAAAPALLSWRYGDAGVATSLLVLLAGVVVWTLVIRRVALALFPIRPGIYPAGLASRHRRMWVLLTFITITNLPAGVILVPFFLRPLYFKLLGLKVRRGMVSIAGDIGDPYLVSLGEGAWIGAEAMLQPHMMTADGTLVLAPIEIGDGALVGMRSVVLPGVTIGDGATVNAMSVVPLNTTIGPGEVWGGNPARRIR